MKTTISRKLLTAGLCLLAASQVQATPDSTLKVTLFGYFQSSVSTSGKQISGKVDKTRITSKELLKLVAQDSGRSIPSGSQLMVSEDGTTRVVDRDGATILDSTRYVRVRFSESSEIFDGTRNLTDGREQSRVFFKITLLLKFRTVSGSISGMVVANNEVSSPDGDGVQRSRVSTSGKVAGKGRLRGGSGLYEGTINLNGRGATIR